MNFDVSRVDTWTAPREYKVEADKTRQYATATDDAAPAHLDGSLAPPVFSVLPVWDVMDEAIRSVIAGLDEAAGLRVLHGEHDLQQERPLVPGTVVRSRARVVGIHEKSSGTTVVTQTETIAEDDERLNTQWITMFFRGSDNAGVSAGSTGPDVPALPAGADTRATIRQSFSLDQTFRYADASGDHMPVHKDPEIAKAVGLPGIIIHGLCTLAFASRAAVEACCDGDPRRLARLRARFRNPAFPGTEIETSFLGDGKVFEFATTGPEGVVVLSNGLVAVR